MENSTGNLQSITDLQKSFQKFGVTDYVVFLLMLMGCSAVGVYYAFRSKPKKCDDEAAEYLMGGRNMKVFPISMSLIASFISGITLLGLPTEVYLYGINYLYVAVAYIFAGILASYLVLPVFHALQLSSTYEYLTLRFDNRVRLFSSILFTISQLVWLPIVIYVPALAFNQVSGVNVHIITPCVCLVCIFYTCVGGLKAVVWTDVIQTFLMVGSMIVVMVKGTLDVGGLGLIWKTNYSSGRLTIPPLTLDPTIQMTAFSLTLGATFHWLQNAILNQNLIQRFLTLPTIKSASRAMFIYILGIVFFTFICGYLGLLAFSTYHYCDPLTTGLAQAKDQVVPLLVMQILGDYPGLPGLFVAGVFSAALSSLSTGLNSLSAVVLEDFIKPNTKTTLSNKATMYILKGVVVGYGGLCVALVFIVEKLGPVLQLTLSLGSMASGSGLGLFTSGLLLPFVNEKGAFWGGIVGLCANAVIIVGNQRAQATGALEIPSKPTYTTGCSYSFDENVSLLNSTAVYSAGNAEEIFILFRLSFLWNTLLGATVTIISASIISYATGGNKAKILDPNCFSPAICKSFTKAENVHTF